MGTESVARRRARLSQADLARRAGVAQSVISAYESDRRERSSRILVKLIEDTGHQLAVEISHDPCREDAYRLVMRCRVRLGESARAPDSDRDLSVGCYAFCSSGLTSSQLLHAGVGYSLRA
ncbi:MAG: helix-turn-helix domain-containing protein [Pseudonocardiaceae bacterium]